MNVFDFDKTLTSRDTLFGFYRYVNGKARGFEFKRLILMAAAVLYKFKILSNDQLKSVGISLFLVGCKRDDLIIAAEGYASTLKLNEVYHQVYSKIPQEEKIVISASPVIYLEKVFPGENVAGSDLSFDNHDVVNGLKVNMYGTAKSDYLKSIGVKKFDFLYTDSFADKPLMDMANRVYLVKRGEISNDIKEL